MKYRISEFNYYTTIELNRLVYNKREINKNIETFVLQANQKEANETTFNNKFITMITRTDSIIKIITIRFLRSKSISYSEFVTKT